MNKHIATQQEEIQRKKQINHYPTKPTIMHLYNNGYGITPDKKNFEYSALFIKNKWVRNVPKIV